MGDHYGFYSLIIIAIGMLYLILCVFSLYRWSLMRFLCILLEVLLAVHEDWERAQEESLHYLHVIHECTPLIARDYDHGNDHSLNTPICWKMQWEFYRSDQWQKRKMIKEIHPNPKSQTAAEIGVIIYIVLSFLLVLYPFCWFLYVWIYLNAVAPMFHADDIGTIIVQDMANLPLYFIWITGTAYLAVLFMWIMIGLKNLCDGAYRNTLGKINAVIFLRSLQGGSVIPENLSETLLEQMPTVGIVLQSQSLSFNSSLIVLSYL